MMIRVGIYGYGNLGRGVETALLAAPDMTLTAVYTRRDPASLTVATPGVPVLSADALETVADVCDVLILCGGSAKDLPVQTPEMARRITVVDSFDTHKRIPEHHAAVDAAARAGERTALISVGWDPGLFSLMRLYGGAILPEGEDYTFWGRGVSQGHSDAIRRVSGDLDGKQYTIPKEEALRAVRAGEAPALTAREKHLRECFVVAEEGADLARIEREIKEMPDYFADYDTVVHFITAEELKRDHSGIPHGGFVIRTGRTAEGRRHKMEFSLALDSNPEFTSSVLVAYARAARRMEAEGKWGCYTVFDVPPAYLSPLSGEELRRTIL